jgi:TonB family protein
MDRKPPKSLEPVTEPSDELGGLETLLAMAAVEPEFARALATRRDEALAASGVEMSAGEKRVLRAAPGESLRQMSVSLESRIPAASRRTFLLRAGQAVALLAGTALLGRESQAQPASTKVWWEDSGPRVGLRGGTGTGSRPDPGRPGRRQRGKVWLRSVKTKGPLSRGIVRRVMNRHLAQIRSYYRKELSKRPKLKGDLKVKFVITPAGKVKLARLVSSTLRAPVLEKSVVHAIRRWRFPMPGRVASTTVTATFRFRPTQ